MRSIISRTAFAVAVLAAVLVWLSVSSDTAEAVRVSVTVQADSATVVVRWTNSADPGTSHHRARLWAAIPSQSQDVAVPTDSAVFTVPQAASAVVSNACVRAIDVSSARPQSSELCAQFTIPGAVQPLTPPSGLNVVVIP